MAELVFTSRLGAQYRDDLERLLFFNENQARASEGVSRVVERYGTPRILVEGDHLRIGLDSDVQPQTLFVVTKVRGELRPIGVVVYTREEDSLVVMFVAIDSDYSGRGIRGQGMLLVRMTNQLKAIAQQVRGVSTLVVHSGRPKPIRIKVRRKPDA